MFYWEKENLISKINFKRVNKEKRNSKTIGIAKIRKDVGEVLCMEYLRLGNSRGRESDLEKHLQEKN